MNNVFWVQLTQMLYRQTFIFRVICKRFNWERSQTGSNLMCFTPDTIWLQFPFLIRQPWEVVVSQTLPMAVSLERTQFLPGLLRCFLPRGFVQHSNVQLQGWMVVGCTCGMRWSELGGRLCYPDLLCQDVSHRMTATRMPFCTGILVELCFCMLMTQWMNESNEPTSPLFKLAEGTITHVSRRHWKRRWQFFQDKLICCVVWVALSLGDRVQLVNGDLYGKL